MNRRRRRSVAAADVSPKDNILRRALVFIAAFTHPNHTPFMQGAQSGLRNNS